ncbi:LPS-assembly protein LptD [Devosia submarina]|uniref:LPS-assembly protein LptD n=1 Tax=Devosia submarina TaxID=1173082 RepID=UPI000D335457|nr:LPS assembly protein LptD [Devosia submarina]
MLRLAGASALAILVSANGAAAQTGGLVPIDLFNAPINPQSPVAVEADSLVFEASTSTITASGNVVVRQDGYTVSGESLVFNRQTNAVRFQGAVRIVDPSGNIADTVDLELTGGLKQAFLQSITITTYDGARITADSANYDDALQTLLENASYSPCGDCIDDKGRRIGWSMRADRITYNAEDGSVYLEQPSLALLGVPVAWLPFLYLPDTSDSALSRVPRPIFSYSDEVGAQIGFEVSAYSSQWTDVIFTPRLMSRQGLLLGAEWIQRFDNGSFQIKGSGVYQLDKEAFSFSEAQRDWRGAVQTSGTFKPVSDWTVGWSYTAFTDAAFFEDYDLSTATSSVNEVYATQLTQDSYFDARVQQFNLLGDVLPVTQDRQGQALPAVRFEHMLELAEGAGRVEISGRLLGVHRERDAAATINGVPYSFGYAGNKQHATFQTGWQNQYIGAGGFVATPYLGGRADVAYYDGTSGLQDAPGETTLWSATPIAAMDVRFPVSAKDGSTVHLVEPIGQLVYRGSSATAVGITNDNAQSFVFDDTNLFSYNRFSGTDRQETGLRVNLGGRYQANFVDGSYLEVIAGQSFQLAGENAFASADAAQTGIGSGLQTDASYAVLGAYGSFVPGLMVGGKLQVDTDEPRLTRASVGANYANAGYSAGLDYTYIAANPDLGQLIDQQEIGVSAGVPIADYWSVKARTSWDITANSFLLAGAGLQYDDGYLLMGADVSRTGETHTSPNDTRITASFRIKAPAGLNAGFDY